MQIDHGFVVFVVIIGMDELQLRSEIALADDFEALDFLGPVVLGVPLFKSWYRGALALALAQPSGVGLKGVQIKMEREKCRAPGR